VVRKIISGCLPFRRGGFFVESGFVCEAGILTLWESASGVLSTLEIIEPEEKK